MKILIRTVSKISLLHPILWLKSPEGWFHQRPLAALVHVWIPWIPEMRPSPEVIRVSGDAKKPAEKWPPKLTYYTMTWIWVPNWACRPCCPLRKISNEAKVLSNHQVKISAVLCCIAILCMRVCTVCNTSKVLHKYLMNEFFMACCSRQTKYFWKKLFKNL